QRLAHRGRHVRPVQVGGVGGGVVQHGEAVLGRRGGVGRLGLAQLRRRPVRPCLQRAGGGQLQQVQQELPVGGGQRGGRRSGGHAASPACQVCARRRSRWRP